MADLQAVLSGSLTLKPSPASPPKAAASTGCNFGLSLRTENEAPKAEISMSSHTIAGAGFVVVPFPANLRARVLYLRLINGIAIDVQLTRVVTAVETISQLKGLLVLEFLPDDELTAFSVQGDTAEFEWAAFGPTT